MDQHFLYEYAFESNDSNGVAHVSHAFKNTSELEAISCFPYQERWEFARYLINKYEAEKYHRVDPKDINCPFAAQLQTIFKDSFMVYWTKQVRVTLLFYTGQFEVNR